MNYKVLFIFNALPQGGAERQAINLANGLCKLGVPVAFCLFGNKPIFYKNLINKHKLTIYQNKKKSYRAKIVHIINTVDNFKPSVVITFMPHNGLLVRSLRFLKFNSIPVIYGIRNTYNSRFSWQYISDLILSFSSYNVYNSNASLDQMIVKINSHYIPNGYDNNWMVSESKKSLNIVKKFAIVGRLLDQKNQIEIINAFNRIKIKGFSNFSLELYGDLPSVDYKNKVKSLIIKYNLEKEVFIRGKTNNIESIYSSVSNIIIPSKREGCPNVLFESLLTKRLVIMSANANSGNFVNNENCLIYNNETELDEFLIKILNNTNFDHIIESGYNAVNQNYSMDLMVSSYNELIKSILDI